MARSSVLPLAVHISPEVREIAGRFLLRKKLQREFAPIAGCATSKSRLERAVYYLENWYREQNHRAQRCFVPAAVECVVLGLAGVIPWPNSEPAPVLGGLSLPVQRKRRSTNNKPHTLHATMLAEKKESFAQPEWIRKNRNRVLANNSEHDGATPFRPGWSDSNNKPRKSCHSPIRSKRAANPLSRSEPVRYKERILDGHHAQVAQARRIATDASLAKKSARRRRFSCFDARRNARASLVGLRRRDHYSRFSPTAASRSTPAGFRCAKDRASCCRFRERGHGRRRGGPSGVCSWRLSHSERADQWCGKSWANSGRE